MTANASSRTSQLQALLFLYPDTAQFISSQFTATQGWFETRTVPWEALGSWLPYEPQVLQSKFYTQEVPDLFQLIASSSPAMRFSQACPFLLQAWSNSTSGLLGLPHEAITFSYRIFSVSYTSWGSFNMQVSGYICDFSHGLPQQAT